MHKSVLLNEAIEFLKPENGKVILDATLGCAGHARKILERIVSKGSLIGIDCDSEALKQAERNLTDFSSNVILMHANFRNIDLVLDKLNIKEIDGALFDLGVSSLQLDDKVRGFSFKYPASLDMRMDNTNELNAYSIVNKSTKYQLSEIIKEFGEERFHKKIAKAIVDARKTRPIETAVELSTIIYNSAGASYRGQKIDAATRTFQAIRIAVNDELSALKEALRKIHTYLKPKARLVVISFHSLEDRIVKRNFRKMAKTGIYNILTKKPVTPGESETRENPRARSGKLRAIEKNV